MSRTSKAKRTKPATLYSEHYNSCKACQQAYPKLFDGLDESILQTNLISRQCPRKVKATAAPIVHDPKRCRTCGEVIYDVSIPLRAVGQFKTKIYNYGKKTLHRCKPVVITGSTLPF